MPDSASTMILRGARALCRGAERLAFAKPVSFIYNPLRYARAPHEAYLARFAADRKQVVFLGMNPGPWGMTQTGVPFGEIAAVRDWLGIGGAVGQPKGAHRRVPVLGFACNRSEVSGRRLWGLFADHYRSAGDFSRHAFVTNYCPLMFLDEAGKNLTPDKIALADREPLYALCDRFLALQIEALRPRWLVGIGQFALHRIEAVMEALPAGPRVMAIPHPSPANPGANRNWAAQARARLEGEGIW